ncbi:MAG: cation:proton antiporter [Porticoccaceae bacterium]|nr:cation:proton antiporter [Porticoccaceae bacterium]
MHDLQILAIIWASVFVASFLAHRTRLTPVLWYLFLGSAMVNLGILPVQLPDFINNFAELGIITIMFALGFEEDTSNFIKSIKRSWGIAVFGALTPFAVAYSATYWLWESHNIALLCGLAMASTTVSLSMVSLKTEGLSKTPAATGIMTSAVLDNIASLALIAIVIPLATGDASISASGLVLIMAKAAAFVLLVTFLGLWLFPISEKLQPPVAWFRHFNLRAMLSMGDGEYSILALLLIAVTVGLLAEHFGFHPAIGAYIAGLIIKREYFDYHRERNIDFYRQAQDMINNIAFAWIGPVFFVSLGTVLVFDAQLALEVLPQSLILFAGLFMGQILSAGLAARYIGHFDKPSSLLIGLGMLGRAELAFVVLDIAYVQYQIISLQAFYCLMLTACLLNLSVPLCIRWWKTNHLPM